MKFDKKNIQRIPSMFFEKYIELPVDSQKPLYISENQAVKKLLTIVKTQWKVTKLFKPLTLGLSGTRGENKQSSLEGLGILQSATIVRSKSPSPKN
jgi:Tat protein secretion system quality control protein TatD with DNase activity